MVMRIIAGLLVYALACVVSPQTIKALKTKLLLQSATTEQHQTREKIF